MGSFDEIHIDSLEFDKKNPRLPSNLQNAPEDDILRYLASKTGIERLMASIGENGFFNGEAIVVIQRTPCKYTVIEGNRRLAALRLLKMPELAGQMRGVARVADAAKNKPDKVPAYVVESRDDTLQYLGFRHISGVQRWDPLSKARYLEALFNRTKGESSLRYTAVAREIGSTAPAVRRNLDALAAYKIIEQKDFYDLEDVEEQRFQFGTFYTAIGNTEIGNFVGVKEDGDPAHPIMNPGVVNEKHLEELTRLMFEKDSSGNTKLGESRNIGKLSDVLDNPKSLAALRSGQSLETAYRLTPHGREEFVRHINRAIDELKNANANLYAVEHDDQEAKDRTSEALKIITLAANTLGVTSND